MITKEDVLKAIEDVKHPAIDLSLVELGIVKTVEVENNKVKIIFAFPFPNIPIADMLINSIKQPIIGLGAEYEDSIVMMTEEEKQRFLMLEQSAWKGM
ncbi:MAG: metal-sulfur cluster biosynthetic enzyme [Bacteroidetes bacterium]|nr:MAG: metal-sulfur cluster biosynthetic enzyme [Bacteroidota bacterium]